MYISYLTQDRAFIKPLSVIGDFSNGDLDIDMGQAKLRVPRFLVTTPIQVCPQCYRAMVMVRVRGQGTLVQCPDYALHQAEGHFKLGTNPGLPRAERRKHIATAKRYRRQCH